MLRDTMTTKPSERLFLLDGMALAYRAYFSFIRRPLINSRGENTSAVYGFVTVLMKILQDERPDHIAVVFDTKEPTFRHLLYEPYKATRQKMPEDLASQLDMLKDVVRAFNVPVVEAPGYEADDVMGTLARRAEREGIETLLVTGDKDFMQLISPKVKMLKPGSGGDEWETVDERGVMKKFGVTPDRVIDVLGLTGDASDNVPGVPGIGEKTAIPLVREYGPMEDIFRNVGAIPQKGLRQKLIDHREQALLSKKLVTIDTGVPLEIDLHHLNARPRDTARLRTLFSQLEFRALLRRLEEEEGAAPPAAVTAERSIRNTPHTYTIVDTPAALRTLAATLRNAGRIALDTETTSTDPMTAELVGLSFCTAEHEAWYVPVRTEGGGVRPGGLFAQEAPPPAAPAGLPAETVAHVLSPLLADAAVKKIGQNIKYDMLVLERAGMGVKGVEFDTMVAHYVLRSDGQHNMDAMAAELLGYTTITYDELTGTGSGRKDIRTIPVERVAEYAAEDADVTLRLYLALRPQLEERGLLRLCEEVEFPLIPVLAAMEMAGVSLDVDHLAGLSKELERTLDNLTRSITQHAGEQFNINSTQQLSKVLFEKLKLTTKRKTKTGYSTDVGVLEELRHEHPVVELLLEYRQCQKLKSTYVDALPALLNPVTRRLHTSFNQTVAATGRLSSSNPNLQNIPIRTEIGSDIRRAFIPARPGLLMLSADYSQIELRIMAHVSGDEGLVEAFRNGEDIHTTTAMGVFGVKAGEVTRDMRRKAKEVNFGIMYGIGPFGLANRLEISQTEAKEIITTYFARFPKVREYIAATIEGAKTNGYVSTLLGRRRYLPEISSRNQNVRSNAERQAINMPIQGTAADMIKIAMVNIDRELRAREVDAEMLLQVHDELVFEVAKKSKARASAIIEQGMKNALPLSVPVDVEIGAGGNWLEAH